MVTSVPNLALRTGYDGTIRRSWHVRNAIDQEVASVEVIILDTSHLRSLLLQIVEGNLSLNATVTEARVILEPVNGSDLSIVTLAHLVRRALNCVEVVDVRVGAYTCRKHVTTVAETNLFDTLHLEAVVLSDRAGQHVHHQHFVSDGSQNVETARMESNCSAIFADWSLP